MKQSFVQVHCAVGYNIVSEFLHFYFCTTFINSHLHSHLNKMVYLVVNMVGNTTGTWFKYV